MGATLVLILHLCMDSRNERDKNYDKGDYYKYCGQQFWELISDDKNLYVDIIEPLGYKAKEKNDKFNKEYSELINKFTFLFMYHFCDDGKINWDSLVKYNSSAEEAKKKLTNPPQKAKGKKRR